MICNGQGKIEVAKIHMSYRYRRSIVLHTSLIITTLDFGAFAFFYACAEFQMPRHSRNISDDASIDRCFNERARHLT